jgi:hypothetical protein
MAFRTAWTLAQDTGLLPRVLK